MSTQSTLTVAGFVGSEVKFSPGQDGGVPFASFRLGCTPRIHDRQNESWRDGATVWYTVKTWRQAAVNVAHSVHKGQPVVVTGRLLVDEWTNDEGKERTSLVIEASALGHDLVFGSTFFLRAGGRSAVRDAAEPQEPATPVDLSGLVEVIDSEVVDGAGDDFEEDDELDELDGEAAVALRA